MTRLQRLRRLTELLFAMKRALHHRLGKKSFPLDPSTLPRLVVLYHVHAHGEPSMKDIAACLRVTRPSATALVDGLVAAGLLRRRADAGDRRSIRLSLTSKGRVFLDRRFREVNAQMAHMFGRLTAKEQGVLIRLFEKLLV